AARPPDEGPRPANALLQPHPLPALGPPRLGAARLPARAPVGGDVSEPKCGPTEPNAQHLESDDLLASWQRPTQLAVHVLPRNVTAARAASPGEFCDLLSPRSGGGDAAVESAGLSAADLHLPGRHAALRAGRYRRQGRDV